MKRNEKRIFCLTGRVRSTWPILQLNLRGIVSHTGVAGYKRIITSFKIKTMKVKTRVR